MSEIQKLPSLSDLTSDISLAFKEDQFNLLLSQEPPEAWVKIQPFAKSKYITIEKVEFLLTRIFQEWKVEVISYCALFQSIGVHVRLHYKHPVTGQWSYQDGLGAVSVQTDAGQSAANLAAIKSDAVMKALPAAESYAVKDAAEKLGKLFGKDLNRKDVIEQSFSYFKQPITNESLKELFEENADKLSKEEFENAKRILDNKEESSYRKLYNKLAL